MRAGALRHQITIQQPTVTQDANGDATTVWTDYAVGVPAAWLSGPGREYLASESIRAEVSGRLTVRRIDGVTSKMRVLWDGAVWNIAAPPLLDPTARWELTLLVGAGGNDG